jgi:hypothetical protein
MGYTKEQLLARLQAPGLYRCPRHRGIPPLPLWLSLPTLCLSAASRHGLEDELDCARGSSCPYVQFDLAVSYLYRSAAKCG